MIKDALAYPEPILFRAYELDKCLPPASRERQMIFQRAAAAGYKGLVEAIFAEIAQAEVNTGTRYDLQDSTQRDALKSRFLGRFEEEMTKLEADKLRIDQMKKEDEEHMRRRR